MSGQPILPWARPAEDEKGTGQEPAEQGAHQEEDDGATTYCTAESLGLTAGDTIEVKWHLEPEEGDAYSTWWRARLQEGASTGPSGEPTYELLYDAHDDFDPETCTVSFTSEHALRDWAHEDELLLWRREGDPWDAESEEEEDDEEDGDAVVSLQALDAELAKGAREAAAEEEAALATMQPAQRIAVAAGFRDFADSLKDFLSSKLASHAAGEGEGGSLLVTGDMMEDFKQQLMAKRQRTG